MLNKVVSLPFFMFSDSKQQKIRQSIHSDVVFAEVL